jgi:hypothetical protein
LGKAEAKLPTDDEFRDFNRAFSRFISLSTEFLEAPVGIQDTLLRAQFTGLANKAWLVFSKQLRIVESDPQYSEQRERWGVQYENEHGGFVEDLDRFDDTLLKRTVYREDIEPAQDDSGWGTVAKSLIGEEP